MRNIALAAAFAFALRFCDSGYSGDAQVSILVIGEDRMAIPGVTVIAGWRTAGNSGNGNGKTASIETDLYGLAHFKVDGAPEIIAMKDGYYRNGLSKLEDVAPAFVEPKLENNILKFEVVLKKKVNPIPMIVREVRAKIPKNGEDAGYDLLINDWTPPFGKGEVADVIVNMSFKYISRKQFDYKCIVKFQGEGNGVILHQRRFRFRKDELRLPTEAPGEGYLDSMEWNFTRGAADPVFADKSKPAIPGPARNPEDDNYIFRIRSGLNIGGVVQGPLYGKIHGAITPALLPFYPKTPEEVFAELSFFCYLNPTGTKNIEWDMGGDNKPKDIPLEP